MAKVFTITEGVENMGALKSGGQGSVYKGRRIGEIITAIKILPTPIHSESGDDKNYTAFQNEVAKLKKVNEDVNANVVTILNSGITETGSFPFIEMEYIEGPDLSELLKPPHEPVFNIKEVLKVADQLSNALAHCHRADVKHGDLKSNNVKYNAKTGNYVLLDFGLSVMSDEQRRTSLRQAGAIEFMAPEQHEGALFFETEVYSFGVILFELLAGTVPFLLRENSESSRNSVMLSHLEMELPNLLALRQQHLPLHWNNEKRELEMQVPEWLIGMIYKCLSKNPADRFANGMVMHAYITRNIIAAAGNTAWGADRIARLEQENENLQKEKEALLKQLETQEKAANSGELLTGSSFKGGLIKRQGSISIRSVILMLCSFGIIGLAAYFFTRRVKKERASVVQSIAKKRLEAKPLSEEQLFRLTNARTLLSAGRVAEALVIYKLLAVQDVPEAMYEYGNLTLLNNPGKLNCDAALDNLKRAVARGYIPAKRTVGLLYAYAADTPALRQKGYQGCELIYDMRRGSKLLMEATLAGDSTASAWLDELNERYSSP